MLWKGQWGRLKSPLQSAPTVAPTSPHDLFRMSTAHPTNETKGSGAVQHSLFRIVSMMGRPGCPQGTRSSSSRHRSRGVAHVSGAPRHGATGPTAARVPGAPTGRSVDIPLPSRGATSAPARCDLQTPGPRQAPPNAPYARHERRCAGHTARSAEVMRDTAGAVSRYACRGVLSVR
jgi:hypothetical protein